MGKVEGGRGGSLLTFSTAIADVFHRFFHRKQRKTAPSTNFYPKFRLK